MKKILLLLGALVLVLGSASAKPAATYEVATAHEFLNALGSNRTIILTSDSYDITDALLDLPSLLLDFESAETTDRNVYCLDNYDGPELHIANISNLTILTEHPVVTFLAQPRYADVITFEKCSGIRIEGVTFGHTEEGYCDRGVLGFYNCSRVDLVNCDLFGCGTEGIILENCSNMTFTATKIRDCSYHIMHLYDSRNVRFESCQFFRNREFEQINIHRCENVMFDNCMIANNTGNLFNITCPVLMRNCVILHDEDFLGKVDQIEAENCVAEEYFHSEQTFGFAN